MLCNEPQTTGIWHTVKKGLQSQMLCNPFNYVSIENLHCPWIYFLKKSFTASFGTMRSSKM